MNLQAGTALVTGGAVRIGRAICAALASRGCGVVVHYHRSEQEARQLVARLRGQGGRAFAVQGALDSQGDAECLIERACEAAQDINILVNNAAVFEKETLMSADEQKVLAGLRVNLLAPMFLTRGFAARLMKADMTESGIKGKVVNLLDRRIVGTEKGCLPYQLCKKALADFTRLAALEMAPSITVNGVAPGAILPPVGPAGSAEGETVVDYAGVVPLQRRCTPEDVAEAVVFLLESDAITGQVVFVDGGQHLRADGTGQG